LKNFEIQEEKRKNRVSERRILEYRSNQEKRLKAWKGEARASSCTSSSASVCFRFSAAVESCTCGGSCAAVDK
jgi:hypothetical protein